MGSRQRQLPAELRRDGRARAGTFTAADNEHAAPVAVVNEAFVKRFFKSDEDPLGQHFGLDLPENAGTFRIVGVVRDAKFAGFALDRPARPMFYVPLAQTVDYKNDADAADRDAVALHRRHHARDRAQSPGALEPVLTKALAEVDPNLTITSVRTMQQQVDAVVRSGARGGEPGGAVRRRGARCWRRSASTA